MNQKGIIPKSFYWQVLNRIRLVLVHGLFLVEIIGVRRLGHAMRRMYQKRLSYCYDCMLMMNT